MTYKFDGTELILQPTEGKWLPRQSFGVDGSGHIIYSSVREFELVWNIVSASDFQQIQNFYNTVGSTGTVIVDLPEYSASSYAFISYTGCTLREPEVGEFFEQHIKDVKLLVMNIQT